MSQCFQAIEGSGLAKIKLQNLEPCLGHEGAPLEGDDGGLGPVIKDEVNIKNGIIQLALGAEELPADAVLNQECQ